MCEIGDPIDERSFGAFVGGKMSNVNVNFGDPGLVDRDKMVIGSEQSLE